MKKAIVVAGFFVAVGLLLRAEAYAEIIQGEITELNLVAGSLRVARSDPATHAAEPETILIQTLPNTQFEGIAHLGELRVGDEILAEVDADKEGKSWVVKKIQIDKVNIRNVEEIKETSKRTV